MTSVRIKPICDFHHIFHSLYLFGAYSPVTGDKFELEFSHCNSLTFQTFLDQFSMQKPKELKVMILDNGAFHKAKCLVVPNNIILIFIPPYSPELNPAEKIWWKYKRAFTNKFFKSLDQVSEFISSQVISLSAENVKSICGFEYFFSSNYWTILK